MTTTTSGHLPLARGEWLLDATHVSVGFTVRHMGISRVRGTFDDVAAVLVVGDDLATTRLEAGVGLSSVDTGNADRDAHLRSTDFFDVDREPRMTFVSRTITDRSDGSWAVEGDLTIAGTTKPLTLDVELHGAETFPGDGRVHAGFEARGELRRSDYGIDFNVPLGAGGFVIADRVAIEIDAQLVAPEEAA